MIIELQSEKLRRGRVGIDEAARGVDRDYPAAYDLEDVGGLKADFHELRRQPLGSRSGLSQAGGDVPASQSYRGEHPQLQPDAKTKLGARRQQDVREVEDASERRDHQPAGERQEER